jgi:hypothetical protein
MRLINELKSNRDEQQTSNDALNRCFKIANFNGSLIATSSNQRRFITRIRNIRS